jgi:hypothetical protein
MAKRWFLTAELWVQSRITICEICGARIITEARFSPRFFRFPLIIIMPLLFAAPWGVSCPWAGSILSQPRSPSLSRHSACYKMRRSVTCPGIESQDQTNATQKPRATLKYLKRKIHQHIQILVYRGYVTAVHYCFCQTIKSNVLSRIRGLRD